ncbi:MAG TPA: CsgG/HfaB family protein [Synergistaceae bacterium]|nr:CsgG/HfaB family protein [Synergistaceae bacterium]HPQ37237.1 CsgG/HfaB family protein [Synergistaceae bacterium]
MLNSQKKTLRVSLLKKLFSERIQSPGTVLLLVSIYAGIFFSPLPVHATETRIAFLEFQVNGKDLDDDLGLAASERVQNMVVRKSRVFVVERTQFKNLAKEHELQYSALVDESTAIEIGKIAGADYVVLGSVNAMGSVVFLTARLVNVQRGLVTEAFEVPSKKGVEGLYYALGDLGTQIAATLQKKGIAEARPGLISPTPTPKPAVPTPTPKPAAPKPPVLPPTATPVPANPEKSYSLGLEAFKRGNRSEAVRHWQDASRTGHAEASARLGECYYHGWGIAANSGKAFSLLKDAAARGSRYARGILHGIDPAKFASYKQDYLALQQQKGNTPKTPIPTSPPATKPPTFLKGPQPKNSSMSPREMHEKGKDFHYGRNGETRDYAQAAAWYRKAADLGYGDAQTDLGFLYEKGYGVPQSLKNAIEWYTRGAHSGSSVGQCNLGYMYEKGRGVSRSYDQAVYWYRKAAEQGSPRGQCNLAYMYEMGQGVPQSYDQAVYWYRKAAEQRYARGEFSLGWMYEKGRGVPQSYAEAAAWYQKAANQGHASAENNLGCLYEAGRGVPRDYQKALYWYGKAADHGSEYGMFNLGEVYEEGTGVSPNMNTALSWYRKAAAKGHEGAQKALARLGQKF